MMLEKPQLTDGAPAPPEPPVPDQSPSAIAPVSVTSPTEPAPPSAPAREADAPGRRSLVTVLQGLLVVVILGIVADLTGVLGFFGIDFAVIWPFQQVRVEATLISGADCAVRLYALPVGMDPSSDAEATLTAMAAGQTGRGAPTLPTVNSPFFAFQVANRTAGNEAVIVSNRATVSYTMDAPAPAHVHAVSLGGGLGCAAGWVQRFEPAVPLAAGHAATTHPVRSPDGDFFTLATGEFVRFSLDLPCATPGAYRAAVAISYEHGDRGRSVVVPDQTQRLCPLAYTAWLVRGTDDIVRVGDYVWNGATYVAAIP